MGFAVTGEREHRRRRHRAAATGEAPGGELRLQIQALAASLGREDLVALRQWLDERLADLDRSERPEAAPDHCERLRQLPVGAEVLILHDNRGRYTGQRAVKIQTPRRGSTRLIIRTADGLEWRYPMAWLKPLS